MNNDVVRIELNDGYSTIVDAKDYPCVKEYNWKVYYLHEKQHSKTPKLYATFSRKINGKAKQFRLHRVILENCGINLNGLHVDHINRDTLDNRRCNLRAVTNQQNTFNSKSRVNATSDFKGVSALPDSDKWLAQICLNGKKINIGRFNSEIEAAKAYDCYAAANWVEFAYLNFPDTELWTLENVKQRKSKRDAESGYRGVSLFDRDKPDGYWWARIFHDGKVIHLGYHFSTPLEAALAYNEAAIRLKGSKAKLNIIP
jgi:hypothetical protein